MQSGEAPFLALDPLLLPLLVNHCPRDELPVVISIIPTRIASAMILKLTKKSVTSKMNHDEVSIVTIEHAKIGRQKRKKKKNGVPMFAS